MFVPESLQASTLQHSRSRPFVRIIEQPSKLLRYRYECEGRPGTIPGASSTADNKIPFAIEIVGYQGRVRVVVSCVTKDPPYRQHPHNLVGQNCKYGVCAFETDVQPDNSIIRFTKLAVQCVKKNRVREVLSFREEKEIDPFLTGFDHKEHPKSIDLNVVRLCFQVFVRVGGRNKVVSSPVVSDPIYNKKTIPDPLIHRLSHCNALVDGGKNDIILLCARIARDNIKIRFFQEERGEVVWQNFATFHPNHIYNNTAICFRPPKYQRQDITEPVRVLVQLVRPSDGETSPPVDFEYLPLNAEPGYLKEKRKRCEDGKSLLKYVCLGSELRVDSAENPPPDHLNPFLWPLPLSEPPTVLLDLERDTSNFVNNIDSDQSSTSRRTSTESDTSNWNIILDFNQPSTSRSITQDEIIFDNCKQPSASRRDHIDSDDFVVDGNVNLDSATGVCQVLNNIDCHGIDLQAIHISSGDLEMIDVDRLSGSFQENLVM